MGCIVRLWMMHAFTYLGKGCKWHPLHYCNNGCVTNPVASSDGDASAPYLPSCLMMDFFNFRTLNTGMSLTAFSQTSCEVIFSGSSKANVLTLSFAVLLTFFRWQFHAIVTSCFGSVCLALRAVGAVW